MIAVVLAAVVAGSAAAAEPHAVGDTLPALEIRDQHEQVHKIDASVRRILFTADMDAGGFVKQALAEDGASKLERAGARYVSNVSRMPALVRRLFALPSLRRRSYPILLDVEGTLTARFPVQEGKATLLVLDALELVRIEHLGSSAEVEGALTP
jgi:hypothetical protein